MQSKKPHYLTSYVDLSPEPPIRGTVSQSKPDIELRHLKVGHIADSIGGLLLHASGLDDLVEASRAGGDKSEH
ncbi:hypothetical protein FVER14953_06164 [Fusarium verticillioides]|nr:hypothetical protein FVER14953_06164 [Fusarium verticillioides]